MLPAQTLLFVCNASNDAAPWIHLSLGLRHANTSLWALSAGGVDLCLVPEVPIELTGLYGVLPHIERVLKLKGKAVIVVAEGAGEELVGAAATTDRQTTAAAVGQFQGCSA